MHSSNLKKIDSTLSNQAKEKAKLYIAQTLHQVKTEEVVVLELELSELSFQQERMYQTVQLIQKNFHQEDYHRQVLTMVQPETKQA